MINGSSRAEAALRQQTDSDINIELRFPTNPKSLNNSKESDSSDFGIYPNPSNETAYITTVVPEGVSKISYEIFDAQGSVVSNTGFIDPINIIEIQTADLPVGIYVCKLYFDGIQVESEKLIIIH